MSASAQHELLSESACAWAMRYGCSAVAMNTESAGGSGIADAAAVGIVRGARRSMVFESKVSRSDFFADRKKWHRDCGHHHPQVTDEWYVTPRGLIQKHELPDGWGLLEPAQTLTSVFYGDAVIVKRSRYDVPDPGWWAHHFATIARITNMRLMQDRYFGGAYPSAQRITIPGMPDELARRLAPLSHTTTNGPNRAEGWTV